MKKRRLRTLIIISAIIITIPIIFFIVFFHNQNISHNQSDWAVFGTYINGLLSPMISLMSLVVLVYIYLIIQKLSSEENHKLYKLKRRIEAYDNLLEFIPEIKAIEMKLKYANITIKSKILQTNKERVYKSIDEIKSIIDSYTKFYFFLINFYPRYGHLFTQEIYNSTYKDLVDSSKKLLDSLQLYYIGLNTLDFEKKENEVQFDKYYELFSKLTEYFNCLRTELYNPTKIQEYDD